MAKSRKKKQLTTIKKILSILTHTPNLILYGPPGTGKTYIAKKIAKELTGGKGERVKIVQFHPAYNYEDFVRGIQIETTEDKDKNKNIIYKSVDRIFAQMCEKAINNKENNYVLIIDEINRANLPAVLGELIYALEYRGEEVETLYSAENTKDKSLIVPDNLYIIGTMNTADRSAGRIDYAVRRRFIFYPLYPDESLAEEFAHDLMDQINNFISENHSPDIQPEDIKVGHTYFMATQKKDKNEEEKKDEIAYKFLYQVIPLLQEYITDGLITTNEIELNGTSYKIEGAKLKEGNVSLEPEDIKERFFK